MRVVYLLIPIAILVLGCASDPNKIYNNTLGGGQKLDDALYQIQAGDPKEKVLRVAGRPADRQLDGRQEAWQYCQTNFWASTHTYAVIWFTDEVVTGIQTRRSDGCGNYRTVDWESAPDATIEVRHR